MSVSIKTPVWAESSAKQSLTLCGQLAAILGTFAVVICLQNTQLASLKQSRQGLSRVALGQEEIKTKMQLSLVQSLPSFGFKNIIADWYFMNFLQYFGDAEVRQQAGYGAAIDYFDLILDRDPRFLYAYYYLSNTGSLYAGQPDRSVDLMAKGLKSLTPKIPNRGYYIWRLKSTDELLFLGKVPDALRSMRTAVEWAKQYSDPESENVVRVSERTVKYLARNPKSKQAQFEAWNMVLGNAIDKPVVERAIAEIRSLGGKVTTSPTGELKVEAPAKD
jgi:tetratricopeptide (TPR) repeat protein